MFMVLTVKDRQRALADYLDCNLSDIERDPYGSAHTFSVGATDYEVLTPDEAYDLTCDYIEDYLDDEGFIAQYIGAEDFVEVFNGDIDSINIQDLADEIIDREGYDLIARGCNYDYSGLYDCYIFEL